MKLKKIRVYGRLRKFLGSSYFEAAVSSPAEAVRFLLCNFPEVEKHMSQQYYKIKMNNLDVQLEHLNIKGSGEIQIIPIATGAGPFAAVVTGIFSAGAAVVSTAATVATAVAGTAITAAGAVGGAVVAGVKAVGGAALTVGKAIAAEYGTTGLLGTITTGIVDSVAMAGITSLIAPTPQTIEDPSSMMGGSPTVGSDQKTAGSFSFASISNVSISGVSVPIIYGEVFTGSVVISSGIDTVEVEGTAE